MEEEIRKENLRRQDFIFCNECQHAITKEKIHTFAHKGRKCLLCDSCFSSYKKGLIL